MESSILRTICCFTATVSGGAAVGLYLQGSPLALIVTAVALAILALYVAWRLTPSPSVENRPAVLSVTFPAPSSSTQEPLSRTAEEQKSSLNSFAATPPFVKFAARPLSEGYLPSGGQRQLNGAQIWEATVDGVEISIQPIIEGSILANALHDSLPVMAKTFFSGTGSAVSDCLTLPIHANAHPGLEREPNTHIVIPIKLSVYGEITPGGRKGTSLSGYLETGVIAVREIRKWLAKQPTPRPTKISVFWLSAWEDKGHGENLYPDEHWPGAKPADGKALEAFNERLAALPPATL